MALPTPTLISSGQYHAKTEGQIDVGPGLGQVPALGNNQLMTLDIGTAFSRDIRRLPGFADQSYLIAVAQDANVTDIRLDAAPFNLDANGDPVQVRLRVDLTAPGNVVLFFEAHHSAGR